MSQREYLASLPCSVCNELSGRMLACSRCAAGYHLDCLRMPRKPSHYWYCDSCKPHLDSGDPAQDIDLQEYLLGSRAFTDNYLGQLEELSRRYHMRGGRMFVSFPEGDRLVPPPAERGLLIGEYHTQYCHLGRDRLTSLMQDDCWWPCMQSDIRAHCQRCLACQL